MNNRVIHFEIQADNIKRAKKFYEKVLSWKADVIIRIKNNSYENYEYCF